jgi:hypothetical protein
LARKLFGTDGVRGVAGELLTAELALALGRAGVNIVDMALYPTPDFTEGLVALWVAGDEPAARAEELLDGLGFAVARA